MVTKDDNQKRAPAALVRGCRGKVNLSVSHKDGGSELEKALWSWTHFYLGLGRSATCEVTATIQLCSVIFFIKCNQDLVKLQCKVVSHTV